MSKKPSHKWTFRARFRRHAFGWKSQPAIQRIKEAVAEIKGVASKDMALAAEGAVQFISCLSPALARVDSSSGAIGAAVGQAIATLVKVIAAAEVGESVRQEWLERLFEAHAVDDIPYIESLSEYWGELCGSPAVASQWADRLLDVTRMALSRDKSPRGHFHGTSACLSALFTAARYPELLDVLQEESWWGYKRWAVKALMAQGCAAEAIAFAEASRGPWASDLDIDCLCEDILLSHWVPCRGLRTLRAAG